MSAYRLSDFTSAAHTLVIEPGGVLPEGRQRWFFDVWCDHTLIFSDEEFHAPCGWSEGKVAASALFWATFPVEERESECDTYTPQQREWLDEYADYLTLALLGSDGQEVTNLSAYRTRD